MVKSIVTVYINSEILSLAKAKELNISSLCEEAMKIAVSSDSNDAKGALKNFFNTQIEKTKDIRIIRKLSEKRGNPHNDELFRRSLRMFCEKYGLELAEAVKLVGL